MPWIDRIPFPLIVAALAAAWAGGIIVSRLRFGIAGYTATILIVGGLTVAYLVDYSRRPGPRPAPVPAPRPAPVSPEGGSEPVSEPVRAPSEPRVAIPDDLSDEDDPVLEADRLASERDEDRPEGSDIPDDSPASGR